MTELSPAAQAMLDAYHQEAIDYIEDWGSFSHKRGLASALEAVADRGECVEIVTAPGFREIDAVLRVSDILAIAAELRPTITQEDN